MCTNQLSQLSSSSHSIYMESLNRAQLPFTSMKGRSYAYDCEASSEDIETEMGSSKRLPQSPSIPHSPDMIQLHNSSSPEKRMEERPCHEEATGADIVERDLQNFPTEEKDEPNVAAKEEVEAESNHLSQESSTSNSIYLDSLSTSQFPLKDLKIEIKRLNLSELQDEAAFKAAVEREIARGNETKQRQREKARLEREKERREAARLKSAAKREAAKLKYKYPQQQAMEAQFPIGDMKEEMREDDILDETVARAAARREAGRLRQAKRRARHKEKLDRELAAPDHEVPETALLRKALIKEIEAFPRLWDRAKTLKGTKVHAWRQLLEKLQVTFEGNPGILARCRADSADKLRHIWYRLYEQHNRAWRRNGWKDSGILGVVLLIVFKAFPYLK